MAISSADYILCWVALEVNTIAIIPLIRRKAVPAYFLAQRLGSALILLGAVTSTNLIVIVGAIIKAGIAPFHMWFTSIVKSVDYSLGLLIITTQKIAPLVIIASSFDEKTARIFAALRCVIGRLGAIKQTQLKGLLAYSSVVHIG